jgi:hypothetical protein
MEPSDKSKAMTRALDDISQALFGRTRGGAIGNNKCVSCGGDAKEFKNDISRKEYTISGLCQKCQDEIWA